MEQNFYCPKCGQKLEQGEYAYNENTGNVHIECCPSCGEEGSVVKLEDDDDNEPCDKLKFITDIVRDCGDVQLDGSCGNYYALTENGESVVALSFVKGGYKTTPIEKLKPKVIDAIYKDLYQDFGESDTEEEEEECLDKKGKPIKVNSKVVWYDPDKSARDLKRIWNVWQISGDIVHIADDNGGEAEVFPNELKVVG